MPENCNFSFNRLSWYSGPNEFRLSLVTGKPSSWWMKGSEEDLSIDVFLLVKRVLSTYGE